MPRTRITVSLSEELASFVRQAPNASALVAEAVARYRAELNRQELEAAYREDAEESAEIDAEWSGADQELPE